MTCQLWLLCYKFNIICDRKKLSFAYLWHHFIWNKMSWQSTPYLQLKVAIAMGTLFVSHNTLTTISDDSQCLPTILFHHKSTQITTKVVIYIKICFRLNISRTGHYDITLVRPSVLLSVYPSVCPWLSFLKIRSLVFSDIAHADNWPWYLVTDKAILLKKKGSLNLSQIPLNRARN